MTDPKARKMTGMKVRKVTGMKARKVTGMKRSQKRITSLLGEVPVARTKADLALPPTKLKNEGKTNNINT